MLRAPRSLWLVTAAAAWALWGNAPALAQLPVIEAGREADVQALFAPYSLGDEIEGWTFDAIAIESTFIDALLRREGVEATLRLEHLDERGEGDEASASFTLRAQGPSAASGALGRLSRSVIHNDPGGFWRARAEPLSVRLPGIGSVDWVVVGLLFFALLVVAAWRLCKRRALLALIVLAGAGLRFVLSPRSLLGAWFYSRTTPLQGAVESSSLVRYANTSLGGAWSEVQLFMGLDYAFALVTPLAVFLHARLLLATERRALLAAALIALLPAHIRFSMSEVSFIPSIVFSSTLFVCAHGVLKGKRPIAILASMGLAAATVATLYARPLNVLFVLLVLFYVLYVARSVAWPRRAAVAAIVVAVATPIVLGDFIEQYGGNVRDGAKLQVLLDGIALVFDTEKNTLINGRMTPWPFLFLVLAALAVAARSAYRRRRLSDKAPGDVNAPAKETAAPAKETAAPVEETAAPAEETAAPFPPRVFAFIALWLALFFLTHAYVIPAAPAMQARYHLHLAVPFVFLAALGAEQVWRHSKAAGLILGLACILAPLTHRAFIEDVQYNELLELAFVREVSQELPEDCAVVEYAPTELDARFRRGGLVMRGGALSLPYTLYVVTPESGVALPVESCVYVYEGLTCWANKEPSEDIAPLCRRIQEGHRMESFRSTSYESRVYDGNLAAGFGPGLRRIQLTLYRAR